MIDLSQYNFEILRKDDAFALCRGRNDDGAVLVVSPVGERPSPENLQRLEHEYSLRNELDSAWAVQPLAIGRYWDRPVLVLNDPGGAPLDQLLAPARTPSVFVRSTPTSANKSGSADPGRQTLDLSSFLQLAISLATTIERLHQRGVVHKDIKPANVFADIANARCWLTGFGIASRLPRERQAPEPPEFVAGTLAYMAPEQTGRMNRSIDSRSDLYALGVTLYEILTGSLPFTASDSMEWVHCHIARQPVPPSEWRIDIPPTISAIILKLLSKTAEDRYQTAAGLVADLRKCLNDWDSQGRIDSLTLGAHDITDQLLTPEKLYGRRREIKTLLDAFDEVVATGKPNLVLVSGYSGIGKSSVVNELHKAIVLPRGIFVSGKFDQHKRDIPYATLAQAFQTLIRREILSKSEVQLDRWRSAIMDAVGPNGQLMVNLIPEVELVIGEQPPVPELPPTEADNRFRRVFRSFLNVFATKEHPLALFVDDLQWLDAATLKLLEDLMTQTGVQYLLLIGAFRDNEVSSSHPLVRTLDAIRQTGAIMRDITLAPLSLEDVCEFVADTLHCELAAARPLAWFVREKTLGNPFFVIQFVTALHEEQLLMFDTDQAVWKWDLERIRAQRFTENVVDLMVAKLGRLPVSTRETLKQLACLGNIAGISTLAMVQDRPEEQVHADLWQALFQGLILRSDNSWKFVHDRIQEAAYSLIPHESRPGAHLHIGRILLSRMTPAEVAENIFDVVNQLNFGIPQISDWPEKEQIAELNFRAGRRAKASTAYASAAIYFSAAMGLLGEQGWKSRYELTFAVWLERAECEFLIGNFDDAEGLIVELLSRAASKIDKAAAYRLKLDLHVRKSEYPQAVDNALDCLRLFGIEMQAHPTSQQVEVEYLKIWQNLGSRSIDSLIDLPPMSDPEMQAAMRVLAAMIGPALFTDINLVYLHLCHMVNVSLKFGTTDASAHGYVWFGLILGPFAHRYADGYRFGKVACDLVERRGFLAYKAKTYFCMELVCCWTQPVQIAIDFIRAAFNSAVETGDLTFACYSCNHLITDLLLQGVHLDEVWRESEKCLDFDRKVNFRDAADIVVSQQRFIENMRGNTLSFSSFSDAHFDEEEFESQLTEDRMATMICWYWILKLQARFMSGDYTSAVAAAEKAKGLIAASYAHIQLLDYHYYAALLIAALHSTAPTERQRTLRDDLAVHLEQLQEWARSGPETFSDKYSLVSAEVARIEGRELDAEHLYEQAIRLAREKGFIQNEGVANELAARFYSARGFETIAHAYLRNARYCYLRWGAHGKVRQLDELLPPFREGEPLPDPTSVRPSRFDEVAARAIAGGGSTIGTPVEHLDFTALIKVSQALAGEIVLKKLIDTLMRTAIEHAGAERGLLIVPRDAELRIEAEGKTSGDTVIVRSREVFTTEAEAPESIIHYVIRTEESVIVDDATTGNPFSSDPYLSRHHSRSILCLPLINQAKLIGLLYLENNLTPRVFTPTRIAVLKLLASQAAISLENTRLDHDLEKREAKIRRLVDANIIGIILWNIEGRIIDANEAFLNMVNYPREDLLAGRLNWKSLTPPEWREVTEQAEAQLKATGILQPYEKEYFRNDGSRVPVLVGSAAFEEGHKEGVSFVLDLTEQKRAEEALRRSQAHLAEAQAELAHVTRVTALGELTASIAHEISQPIAAVVTNANAGLRWLSGDAPNLAEAREAIRRISRDGKRAGDVITRVRALFKKTTAAKEPVDINGAIQEVLAVTQDEVQRNQVSVQSRLANDLPIVIGDKVQLQQVILNLLMNAIEAMGAVTNGPRELAIASFGVAQSESGETRVDTPWTHVLIAVRDSGLGLDPKSYSHLFDAFFTTKPQGLGMGLAISRSIVEAHGGRLWAKPNAPRGAVFQFTLPIQE